VVGRSDDMVVVRGLNLFPTMVAAVLSGMEALSGDYRIVLDAPPPYDALPITVELAKGREASDALRAEVEAAMKRNLGATARVTLVPHGTFPVTEGKTKRVLREY
jgi:phenylacetate-CoA ligase